MSTEKDGMVIWVTDKYDAMRQFFIDLGLDVTSEHPSWGLITPTLNSGRGCMIMMSSLWISLEERTDVLPSGPLYLLIDGIADIRIAEMSLKYSVKHVKGGFGSDFYRIIPPDGGVVLVTCA
jgi:hypothetical protein